MKRFFFTWILMLVTAMAVHAQSLTGKQWCTVLNDEDGQGIAVALTFEKNGTCEILIAPQHDMEEEGVPITLVAGVTVPGSYKRDGNDLNTRFNNGKAKVDIDYEIKGMDGMPKMDHLKIVSLDSNRLVVKNDDNQEIPFFVE